MINLNIKLDSSLFPSHEKPLMECVYGLPFSLSCFDQTVSGTGCGACLSLQLDLHGFHPGTC